MGDSGKCQRCPKTSTLRCSFCRVVFYCSKEHQKKDWKRHKPFCTKQKFEICKNDELGRYLISMEQLKPDEILFKDKPLILGPKIGTTVETEPPNTTLFCLACYQELLESDPDEDAECVHCSLPICSTQCSENPWHKNYECRFFSEAKFNQSEDSSPTSPPSASDESATNFKLPIEKSIKEIESVKLYNKVSVIQSLLYFRCILMKHFYEADFINLLTLQSNIEFREDLPNLEKTAKVYEDFKKIFMQAQHPLITSLHKPELHQIVGIVATNGTQIQISTNFTLIGIYPTFSLMEHSCFPNTKFYFIPKAGSLNTIELYVRSSIKVDSGDHLSTTYTNLLWSTDKRREDLKKRKYFTCTCARCNDPTELGSHFSTLRCPLPECTAYSLPITKSIDSVQWQCQSCTKTMESWQVAKVDRQLAEMVAKLKPDIEHYRDMLLAMETLVHPNYYLNFIVNHSLIQLFGKDEETRNSKEVLDEKIKISNQLLSIIKTIDPGLGTMHIYAAVIYYEMQSAILALAGGEGEDDFKILRNNPESVKLAKIYLQKCLEAFAHEFYDLPENKLKILAEKKMEYLNMIIKHSKK